MVVTIVCEMNGALVHFLATQLLLFEVQILLKIVNLMEGHFEFFL